MMTRNDAIAELQRSFEASGSAGPFWEAAIERWTDGNAIAEESLLNGIAADLALGYAEQRLSFEFCDWAVNGLFGAVVRGQLRTPQPPFPKLFLRVYEAFDAGEYHRRDDRSDDPVAEHTAPAIAAIITEI